MDRYVLLVDILLDSTASLYERDDAAIDFAEFDNDFVVSKLTEIAQNNEEDDTILSSCGASFAEIIIRRNLSNSEMLIYRNIIDNFATAARNEAESLVNSRNTFKRSCDRL